MLRCCSTLALAVILGAIAPAVSAEKPELPLVYKDGFEKGADNWQPTDPSAWKILETDRGKVYGLVKRKSKYKPKHRSPHNIALLKGVKVGDFVLKVKIKSTRDTGNHRDACLFFNYQDPTHFYYVHLGKRADRNSCQIMIVDDAPRKKITVKGTKGIPWDDKWHDVKLVRRVSDGTIEVYFDDMKKPILTANDKTFGTGQIGLGSFDDMDSFDDVTLYGKK